MSINLLVRCVLVLLVVDSAVFGQPVTGDLQMNALGASPTSVTSGGTVNLTWTVSSLGTAGGIGQVTGYTIQVGSNTAISRQVLVTIPNGQTSGQFQDSAQMPTVTSTTSFSVTVTVQGDSGRPQNNNSATRNITVTPVGPADFVCNGLWNGQSIVVSDQQNATTTPTLVPYGVPVYANFSILDAGGPPPAGVPVTVLLDNLAIGADFGPYGPVSGAGWHREQTNIVLPANRLGAGQHHLVVWIDSANIVPEANDNNNQCDLFFTIADPPLPNLAFATPTGWSGPFIVSNQAGAHTSTTTMTAGDTAYISIGVQNSGNVASPSFTAQLRRNGSSISSMTIPAMNPGDRLSRPDLFQITNLAAGSISLTVVLDPNNQIAELDETDNTRPAINVTVNPRPCPTITSQPSTVTICPTGSANFAIAVSASGGPFSYQWQVQGGPVTPPSWLDLADGSNSVAGGYLLNASGALMPSLTVSHGSSVPWPPAVAPSLQFRCVVSNGCAGGSTASAAAMMRVCDPDLSCDLLVTPGDIALFVSMWAQSLQDQSVAGDFDGNGVVNPADVGVFVNKWFETLPTGC